MNINEIKYGFKLLEVIELKDLNAKLYHYEHLKSGGNVYHVENDDTNCCFAIGFRTLPQDSTGVCHIIEHSLLCGSKKYPLKEPFVNLLKSSLSTFLNAFTAYDWTMYPFASQTPRDFDNILSIYCDAVFNPLSMIDPKPFLQEGWHLELFSKDELPQYKGVVYNEMKGAMSSVDEVLTQATLEAMYKDTFYKNNSGGDPDVIPELTYEDYKAFYKKHYTPQNAMTYFYGALDIESKLKFLDENYFDSFEKSEEEIVIVPQEPFVNLDYEKDYEIGEEEDVKDNTYMSLCYGLDHYDNYEEYMAMQILCDALFTKNDSPVKKVLLESKLGQNVSVYIDDDNIIPALHVRLQKSNKDKNELFKKTFEDAVRDIVNKGIDRELLLASINFAEFQDKEMDMGRMPKGLHFAMIMMGSFNYRSSMTSHLEFSKYYEKFRNELKTDYFERILEKYILNSKHNVQVVVNPSKTLAKEKEELMKKKMADIKANMSEQEIDDLIKLNQELLAYQNHVDTKEELATLPKLELKDIPSRINFLDSKKVRCKKMEVFSHELTTNKIGYLRMYFNLKVLTEEELPYVSLLTKLFLNVKTNKHTSLELTNLVKTYLGDLSFRISTLSKDKHNCHLLLGVSSSALLENIPQIPSLVSEVLLKSKFTKNEIKQNLNQHINNLRRGIIGNGMAIAMSEAKAHTALDAYYSTLCMQGPRLYNFYNDLLKNFNYREISNKLNDICKKLFSYSNVKVSISGDSETLLEMKKMIKKIKLNNIVSEEKLNVNLEAPNKKALIIPSGVSYNALAFDLEEPGYNFNGSSLVLTNIVNYDYLWNEIRVKGGAYGCGLSISRNNDLCLGTYRDPNVSNSYQVFENLPNYLRKFKVSKDQFEKYIIGALGNFDSPMSTPSFINNGDVCYLTNYTKQEKAKLKKEVISAKQKDINEFAKVFESMIEKSSKYTIGNSTKINEYPFDEIKSL